MTMMGTRPRGNVIDRLTDRSIFDETVTGCWLWQGHVGNTGYARIRVNGVRKMIHRAAWEEMIGPLSNDDTLDHLCRVRHCWNPAHLEPVDQRTNILRGIGPAAENARKDHCHRGHPFSPENTLNSRGRRCRACRKDCA